MKRWTATELSQSPWFQELLAKYGESLKRQRQQTPDRRPQLTAEAAQLEQSLRGWSQSLANPELPQAVRSQLERDFAAATEAIDKIQIELSTLDWLARDHENLVSIDDVANRINRLADTIMTVDATRANLELSLHIDSITGHTDGRVVVRTCKLGALTGAIERLTDASASVDSQTVSAGDAQHKTKRRRRARLSVGGTDEQGNNLDDAAYFVADVNRFAGLGPEWFWEDELKQPEPTFWAKENAVAVAAQRANGMTHANLAEHFQVSIPTIRHALAIAAENDPAVGQLPRKQPRKAWPNEHFAEVATKKAEGLSIKELCSHFKKSQPLISRALRIAESQAQAPTSLSPSSERDNADTGRAA